MMYMFLVSGPRPEATKTEFASLNAENIVPKAFEGEWGDKMDRWGNGLLSACFDIASAAAEGFGLPSDTFTSMMQMGPHLLAPTGTDLKKFGKVDTAMAGFHYDLNFLTCHGKSRFPGLFIWLRDGTKVSVKVPDGCLLMQAGKQLEYMTGGHVLAGFHEVIVTDATLAAVRRRKALGGSHWRVSSTLFSHLRSDALLQPVPGSRFDQRVSYPAVKVGQQVEEELRAIKLGQ